MPNPPASFAMPARKPEILAPAGGRAQLEAAVWAGADAVYFGLDSGLNARVRATSFALDELPATLDYLHERGVRGYLTLNTLVYDEELARAEQLVRAAAQAGVDALIVQDIGLARLARRAAPDLPLHGSTQMSVTDAAGVAFAAELGIARVVLGRELSMQEIATVVAASDTEIEVFVHGALCVSYSGQCYSSEAWGGRSANRGQCAQACRLPYGLIVDGAQRDQGDMPYLLSPQDLMGIELLPRLVRAGVHSLKIEGRLKGPDYVVATVGAYREALDSIWDELHHGRLPAGDVRPVDPAQRRRLAQVFSRGQRADADGLTPGFLLGPQHQSLVIGRNPRHRGLYIGSVDAVTSRGVRTQLAGPVKRGDGLVFDHGQAERREAGGNIHHVLDADGRSLLDETDSGPVELVFGDDFDARRVHVGDLIWRTRDSARDRGPVLDPQLAARPVSIEVRIEGSQGAPLVCSLTDPEGRCVRAASQGVLQPASGSPLDAGRLRKAFGTLGDTPFVVGRFDIALADTDNGLFLPVGDIKAARRAAVDALLAARRAHTRDRGLAAMPVLPDLLPPAGEASGRTPPRLSVLCRTLEQVQAVLAIADIDEIVVDFLEVHGLKDACAEVRTRGRRLVVAAPRIFKPGEERLWRYYCRLSPDALLVRSSGLLWELRQRGGSGARLDGDTVIPPLHGDFSLNAANVPAALTLFDMGLQRLTLTHDLNGAQTGALARALPSRLRERVEVVAHQHLPIFHTEYCVFARFLSSGNSYRDCGRPCESHRVHMRDAAGGDHLVQADIGCRNTVFNAAAQSAGPLLDDLRDAGIARYRIELVDEPAVQAVAIVDGYLDRLAGRCSNAQLWARLRQVTGANGHRQGVGLGSLAVTVEPPRSALKRPTAR